MFRVTFFLFTVLVWSVTGSLAYNYSKVSMGVLLGMVMMSIQCFGQVTTWDCFRPKGNARYAENRAARDAEIV